MSPPAWPVMPGVPAMGHFTSGGAWHPGAADNCVKCEPTPRRYPVIWAPGGEQIGMAATEQQAIRCAARIPRDRRRERLTASLRERLGYGDEPAGMMAWFVGPQLIQGRRR